MLHTQSSRCHLQIPGVIPALCSRGLLPCRYSGAPAGPSSAEITKGFCLPALSQPMPRGSSSARTVCQELPLARSPSSPPSFILPPPVPALRRLRRRLCLSREPLAVPPFSSSSPPSQCSHPPGGRQRLRNSPVEITDSSVFTR